VISTYTYYDRDGEHIAREPQLARRQILLARGRNTDIDFNCFLRIKLDNLLGRKDKIFNSNLLYILPYFIDSKPHCNFSIPKPVSASSFSHTNSPSNESRTRYLETLK
jgi:hypothetical protein